LANTANSSLSALSLDYDDWLASLIEYMRGTPEFKDYDYEGSNIRALMRVMAYNAWKMAFYTNMDITESFLDSAQVRTSVVSRAKELNYVPRSVRSAQAQVRLTFTGSHGSYVLTKGQTLSTVIKNTSLNFSIPETTVVTSPNGSFTTDLTIYEGPYLSDAYTARDGRRYIVTNPNVDTSSLAVVVFEDGAVTGRTYRYATSLLGLDENSRVFFLQVNELDQYEVVFGDGVVGRKPKEGARVVIDYRVSVGEAGNGARTFTLNFNPGPTEDAATINVQTISISSGGLPGEDLESIRFFAPRHFQVQERASAPEDYGIMLQAQFPEIRNVSVYGGEELDPPLYRKVFVAVDIPSVDGLPESKKQAFFDFLKPRCPKTISPEFVPPINTYVAVKSTVTYDVGITSLSPAAMQGLIVDAISDFSTDNLGTFGATLRYSRFIRAIDESSAAVVGNQTDLLVYKKTTPARNTPQNLDVHFEMPVYKRYPQADSRYPIDDEYSITSDLFTLSGTTVFLEDDGDGHVFVVRTDGNNKVRVVQVGTMDYDSGLVQLRNFTVSDYPGSFLKVFARPASKDVSVKKNTILSIEPDEVSVDILQVVGDE